MKWISRPHLAYCYRYARRQMVRLGFYDVKAEYVFMIACLASERAEDRIVCEHNVDYRLRSNGFYPLEPRTATVIPDYPLDNCR